MNNNNLEEIESTNEASSINVILYIHSHFYISDMSIFKGLYFYLYILMWRFQWHLTFCFYLYLNLNKIYLIAFIFILMFHKARKG